MFSRVFFIFLFPKAPKGPKCLKHLPSEGVNWGGFGGFWTPSQEVFGPLGYMFFGEEEAISRIYCFEALNKALQGSQT